MSNRHPIPPREDLVRLRESGMSREEIAAYYDVSLGLVKVWIREHRIPPSIAPKRRPHQSTIIARQLTGEDTGLTLVDRAKAILKDKVTEDRHRSCYLLDGRPVSIAALLAAAGLKMPDHYFFA